MGADVGYRLFVNTFWRRLSRKPICRERNLYFPGLAKHHVFYARLAYQNNLDGYEDDIYNFRNQIPKPRGHDYPTDANFTTAQVNYALPLWYPDIALGPILNIQRIKANLFYDFGKGEGVQYVYDIENDVIYGPDTNATYQSLGVEATVDFNIFRLLPRAEVGVRSTYRLAEYLQFQWDGF